MNNAKFCVIAVGYNRPDAMCRLLNSIVDADYDGDCVDLLISIDCGKRQQEIVSVANQCNWKFGKKRIRAFETRQGLREHILQCGDETSFYDAIIVLEDDVTVSKAFYSYAKQCVEMYENDERIAGISLYRHHINVEVNHFFEAEFNGFDCFAMQFAQSWGECWTSRMWNSFRTWYLANKELCFAKDNTALLKRIPNNIINWGEKSWMKYYMAYIVDKDLYFIYPYFSLSTNHSEAGQHRDDSCNDYQVALNNTLMDYRLPKLDEAVKYDVFFERVDFPVPGYKVNEITMDLYGNKKIDNQTRYLISTAKKDYRIVESFELKYRPHELNCVYGAHGKDIFVYDTTLKSTNLLKIKQYLRDRYDVRSIGWKNLIGLGISEFLEAVRQKILVKFRRIS